MEGVLHLGGGTVTTPLRRKSMLVQRFQKTQALFENDDEAERMARRQSITAKTPTGGSPGDDRRNSLGLAFLTNMPAQQMTMKISECIKLNTENKINIKNAFSLEMIDFMAYMIRKQDEKMSSLQMATTSLDVSTKIYGFRVDGVHTELLRMMGVHDKQNKNESESTLGTESLNGDGSLDPAEGQKKKRKKKENKNKQKILVTAESLRTIVETAKPSALVRQETDVQTADLLSQTILPLHANSAFYLHPYNDVIIDTLAEDARYPTNGCCIPPLKDIGDMEICPAFSNFDFDDWHVDSEPEEMEHEPEDNSYQFDAEASVPQAPESSAMNYFDIEHDHVEEDVNMCAPVERPVERIVDFQRVLNNTQLTKPSEYSIVPRNLNIHWAGPAHWKVRNFRRPLDGSIETRAPHGPLGKRKSVELDYSRQNREKAKDQFVLGQAIKLQARTAEQWFEERLLLPADVHYTAAQAVKCYLQPTVVSTCHAEDGDPEEQSDENFDSSEGLCHSVTQNEDFEAAERFDVPQLQTQCTQFTQFTGDNLVTAPKLANKLAIAYSTRDKKVDMRELKKTMWSSLVTNAEKQKDERIEEAKAFGEVYKELPQKLTKTKFDALSFPITFVSLLHLANEKILSIDINEDRSELLIKSG